MNYVVQTIGTYYEIAGFRGVLTYIFSKISDKLVKQKTHTIQRRDVASPISLRIPSSDVLTYRQVFIEKEYSFNTNRHLEVIIDAGANVGLASVFLSNLFPDAKIIAIEPEKSNFDMLKINAAAYKNIIPLQAALWNENKEINLVDPGLGNSGFMTGVDGTSMIGESIHRVEGMTLDRIMEQYGIDFVDVLKIDIEGAELEVLSSSSNWIDKVDLLIVELHDRMKLGCTRSFDQAVMDFGEIWRQGENVYASRRRGWYSPVIS